MSLTTPRFLLETRGIQRDFDAYVVAASFDRNGSVAAFALGDGTLRMLEGETWRDPPVHDGAILSLAADPRPGGFITGGDDGRLRRVARDGGAIDIASFGSKWVDHVATHLGARPDDNRLACVVGRTVHLFDLQGDRQKSLDHPSTVSGVVFDAKGKRVAASHYNGASLWFVGAKTDNPKRLEWKGSHIGVAMHPAGDAVVTAMQENSLHGWRLSDSQNMRMSGYPEKTRAMSFTRSGKYLASSGADCIVLWPFFGGGPMGKAPLEIAGGAGVICSFVACHPQQETVAAGFADGLVLLADIATSRILPIAASGHGPISALAWSPDGTRLAIGSETGFAALVDFTKR